MEKTIDTRGKTRINPLIMAKDVLKTLSADDKLNIVVDNIMSAQDLEKMAQQMNMPSQKIQQGNDYVVSLFVKKSFFVPQQEEIKKDMPLKLKSSFIVVADSNIMGKGDAELGADLMKNFIYTLTGSEELPTRIILYNSGVKLATDGSGVLNDLRKLQSVGVEIAVSEDSLDFYGLRDKLAVGKTVTMTEIVKMQTSAEKIIKP